MTDITYQLNNFTVTAFSAQWTAENGNATNLLPTNNPNAATTPFWNSAAGSQNYPSPYWVSFDLGRVQQVTQFQYKAYGDTTHDPKDFQIQTSDAANGTYTTVGSFTGVTGSSLQTFTLTAPVSARYWKFNILHTYSAYQAWVPYVNFVVAGRQLNDFTVTGFSAQWTEQNGNATNLLPANNPNVNNAPFWNAAVAMNNYPNPYWVSFDLGDVYNVRQFQYAPNGDNVHDPAQFELQTSDSANGTYTTVGTFTGVAGAGLQKFTLAAPVAARYWKFNILATVSGYQAWIAYVNFVV